MAHGVAQRFAFRLRIRQVGRFDWMQCLLVSPAEFLDEPGIAMEHLEDGQRSALARHLLGHVIRGGERHEGVIAVVIVPAERAGIGQRGGGDEFIERQTGIEFRNENRQEFIRRRFL